jgi:AraC family transcriptional regulator of adaptative response/methylated-DNA-[protein]-cysteine methyltransferase
MTSAAANQAYPVIAAAIRYIQDSAPRQPDLAGLADYTGYSADHLQRMFSQWAGISPKRFLQFLTAQFARQQLQQGRDVLSVSMAAGLSSPGRLHELIVTLESVTPGELATGGAGITITWGVATCPLGVLLGGITERGVCFLRFITDSEQTAFNELSEQWYGAAFVRDDRALAALSAQLFGQTPTGQSVSLLVKGTNFQVKVWEALLRTPMGHVTSYGDLAAASGSPGASRAVGTAMACNQLAVLIPCHRVIRENGVIGQYRWGSERKSALLLWEHVQRFGA